MSEREIYKDVFLVTTETSFWLEHRKFRFKTPEEPIENLRHQQILLSRQYQIGADIIHLTDKEIIIP
jgi:hypothetical protein